MDWSGMRGAVAECPGTHARVLRGAHPALRGRHRSRRHHSGVPEELGGLANCQRGLLAAERQAIVSLRDRDQISLEMMRRIMRDLDLEGARIGG